MLAESKPLTAYSCSLNHQLYIVMRFIAVVCCHNDCLLRAYATSVVATQLPAQCWTRSRAGIMTEQFQQQGALLSLQSACCHLHLSRAVQSIDLSLLRFLPCSTWLPWVPPSIDLRHLPQGLMLCSDCASGSHKV